MTPPKDPQATKTEDCGCDGSHQFCDPPVDTPKNSPDSSGEPVRVTEKELDEAINHFKGKSQWFFVHRALVHYRWLLLTPTAPSTACIP